MDIYKNLSDGKYDNQMSSPWLLKISSNPREVIEERLEDFVGTLAQYEQEAEKLKVVLKQELVAYHKAYNLEDDRLRDLFCNDLAIANGIPTDHPDLQILFEKAWNFGYEADGWVSVADKFAELAEIINH